MIIREKQDLKIYIQSWEICNFSVGISEYLINYRFNYIGKMHFCEWFAFPAGDVQR